MSTASPQPPTRSTADRRRESRGIRPEARVVIPSGWYDPDGAGWEPDHSVESTLVATSSPRPAIRVEGLRADGRLSRPI
jgi:hypothetical protein